MAPALVAAIVAAAGAGRDRRARLVAGGILRDVEAIRDGLAAVGRGERDVRIRPPPATSWPSWPPRPTR